MLRVAGLPESTPRNTLKCVSPFFPSSWNVPKVLTPPDVSSALTAWRAELGPGLCCGAGCFGACRGTWFWWGFTGLG